MRQIFFATVILIALTGCKFDEDVVFRKIDKVKVNSIIDGVVNLSGEAEFYNPNDISGKLKTIDLEVLLDDKVLARIAHTESLKIEQEAVFAVPFKANFKLEDIQEGLLGNIISIIRGNRIKLQFQGEIKVSTWGFTQTVPVNYFEEVKLQ